MTKPQKKSLGMLRRYYRTACPAGEGPFFPAYVNLDEFEQLVDAEKDGRDRRARYMREWRARKKEGR